MEQCIKINKITTSNTWNRVLKLIRYTNSNTWSSVLKLIRLILVIDRV